MKQEHITQLQLMEQEIMNLNEQLKLIENNVSELKSLEESLDELDNKNSKEILINIGKKVYIPVEIKEKKLFVDVGKNNIIRKSIKETKEIINQQIYKLFSGKGQIMERLQDIQEEMEDILIESENENEKD